MEEQNIHHFTQAVIPLFQNCEFCGEKIISIFNSAYQCTHCLKFCHKQCCDTADSIFPCKGKPDSSINQETVFRAFPVNHTLAENSLNFFENFMKPTFLKKEVPETQINRMTSYRSRPSQPEVDDDSDAESSTTFSNNGLGNTMELDSNPRRSSFLDGSPILQTDIMSPYSQQDKLLSQPGFLTVIIQQAKNISLPGKISFSLYSKVCLLPWGTETYRTKGTHANEGFPDWDGHNNTFSLEYPGALHKVNPILRVSIKCERSLLSLKKQSFGVAQISLRQVQIEPNKYNDNWYPLYRDGKITDGRVRVSFMFCPVGLPQDQQTSNPRKTHYFEKQTLDATAFSAECPVCRKTLLSGIVDTIYKCKVCGMMVHSNCRERAKSIFRCIPIRKQSQDVSGDLSEKVLQSIKKDRLLVYDQPIGRLVIRLNQITFFNLKYKHKSVYLRLSCDQIDHTSATLPFKSIIDINSDEFCFSWFIFDPAAVLKITVKDRISLQTLGTMKLSLQQVVYDQSVLQFEKTSMLTPLSLYDIAQDTPVRTFDLVYKAATQVNTTGSISLSLCYFEQPVNLLSSQHPPLPPIPDMTPAVVSGLWVRFWQVAKIFLDIIDYVKFAVSWDFKPLSFAVAVFYFGGVILAPLEYIHLYLMIGIILLFIVTFILRKKHIIAKTIQTTEEVIHTSNDFFTSSLINIVNTPVNQMKNTLSGATLILFVANLAFVVTEKMYHLLIWTHPEKTRFFLIMCILVSVLFMVIPLRVILFAAGLGVLLPKKISIVPYLCELMNYINSLPDDDQVYELLRPTPQYTMTADGEQHLLNRGYCRAFFDVLIVEGENLWQTAYIAVGYDELVRKWACEADVDKQMGKTLFQTTTVETIDSKLSFRELAKYGFKGESDWTPNIDNSVSIHALGHEKIVISFKSTEIRDSFLSAITKRSNCNVC